MMVLFSEPEAKLLVYSSKANTSRVNFTCVANEVYPEPKLFLYVAQAEETHKQLIFTKLLNKS